MLGELMSKLFMRVFAKRDHTVKLRAQARRRRKRALQRAVKPVAVTGERKMPPVCSVVKKRSELRLYGIAFTSHRPFAHSVRRDKDVRIPQRKLAAAEHANALTVRKVQTESIFFGIAAGIDARPRVAAKVAAGCFEGGAKLLLPVKSVFSAADLYLTRKRAAEVYTRIARAVNICR